MQQQILFSGITPAQFSKEIINGVKEELKDEIARLMSLSLWLNKNKMKKSF
jgi:hypothetical protein